MTFHIAYACNAVYAVQTAVSMVSVCRHHPADEIIFYLIEDGIDTGTLRDIQKLITEKCGKKLKISPLRPLLGRLKLAGMDRHPATVYAKIFLEKVCPADRVIYLDSDTVVTAPLTKFLLLDMRSAYIAGVKMPYTEKQKADAGLPCKAPYLCDGVLLINLQKWRQDHMMDKCTAYIRSCHGSPPMLSEGTVNHVARGQAVALAPEYNLMSGMLLWTGRQLAQLYGVNDYYTEDMLLHARKYPVVIHYLNELYIRPWYKNSDHPYRGVYRQYLRMLEWNQKIWMQTGCMPVRTRMLRALNRVLPFWIFWRLYHAVKK